MQLRGRYWISLGLAALIIESATIADDLHDRLAPDDLNQIRTIHSGKRRITIMGRNQVDMVRVARLVEDALDRIDRALRHKARFGERSSLRIRLAQDNQSRAGRVVRSQRLTGKRLNQVIALVNPGQVETDDVLEALAWAVLSRHVLAGVHTGTGDLEGVLPRWLSEGLGQSLYKDIRARNYERIMWRRAENRTIRLADLVAADTVVKDHDARRPEYELIVAWILASQDSKANLASLFKEIRAGQKPGMPWFVEHVPGCATAEDVERAWDAWLERQGRRIVAPGTLPPSVLRSFRAEQILRRGQHGIPKDADLPAEFELQHLIGMRTAPWLKPLVRDRVAVYRSLAIARGDEFKKVVELYVTYLEALEGKAIDVQLARVLGRAERALEELEKNVAP